jgi:hypothetical protein
MVAGAPSIPVTTVQTFALANPPGDLSTLELAWIATPCERAPTLTLDRAAGSVRMVLDQGVVPPDCESMGIVWGVTLELSKLIDHSTVRVLQKGGS